MLLKNINKSFLIVILLISCKNSTEPIQDDVVTTKDDLSNFQTIIADYDSVVFKNNDDLLLKKKDVKEITIGTNVGGVFSEISYNEAPDKINSHRKFVKQTRVNISTGAMAIEPSYTEVDDKFRLEFEIPIKVNETIYIENFIVRFTLTDDTYIDIESPVDFYKYPYENAEIFLPYDPGPSGDIFVPIQDFDIVGDYLYYHPYAAFGLFRYNMKTGETKNLLNYGGGDHVATTDDYIFCDISHNSIHRYNIEADSIDLAFDMQQIEYCLDRDGDPHCSNLSIFGLAAGNGVVYAVIDDQSDENLYFAQFDYSGNYLGSVTWDKQYPYNLEYYDSVLYSYQYFLGEDSILRFDLNSMSFLDSKRLPSPSPDGISIVNGRFYYADYYRNTIFSIPLSDLMD